MKTRIEALAARIDALSLRERTLLTLTVLAVLFGLWYAVLYEPLVTRASDATSSLSQVQRRFQQTTQKLQQLVPEQGASPDAKARKQLAALKAEIAGNEKTLEAITAALIPPQRMGEVLKTLLLREPGLKLVSVESHPPTPLVKGEKNSPLYTHRLTLTFDGRYGAVLAYLRKVEALPWRLDWQSIRIDTRHYPINRITLQVHTISFSEAWLGT